MARWQMCTVSQLSTNRVQTFTANLLQTVILKSLRVFASMPFCMLGFLSDSRNHRPPKQVAALRAHIKRVSYRMSSLWQAEISSRIELSHRNTM